MNMFFTTFKSLCTKMNIDIYKYGKSTVDRWKNGSIPNGKTLLQISQDTNCSIDYLLGLTDVKERITSDTLRENIPEEDRCIINMYRKLSSHDREIVDHIFNMEEEGTEHARIYRFPVFYQSAAAGVGRLDVSDGYSMENFTIDNLPDEATFIMEIAGESMYDEKTDYLIHTGSKVLIDPKISKYNLDEKIVIANFKGKTICKRYIVKDTYILFQSDNDAFEKENRKSTDDPDHKVVGIVLGVIEDEKFIPVK